MASIITTATQIAQKYETKFGKLLVSCQIETKFFKKITEVIQKHLETAKVILNKNGIQFYDMDLSHIILYHIYVDKEDCMNFTIHDMSKFNTDNDKAIVSLDFSKLLRIMELIRIKPHIYYTKGDLQGQIKKHGTNTEITLLFCEKGLIVSNGTRKITMQYVENEPEEINIEALYVMEYHNNAKIQLEPFYNDIQMCEIFGETITLHVKIENNLPKLFIKASSDAKEYDLYENEVQIDTIESKDNKPFKNVYAISMLKNMLIPFNNYMKTAIIEHNHQSPLKMRIDWKLNSFVTYFLAPRVEDQDDDMYD